MTCFLWGLPDFVRPRRDFAPAGESLFLLAQEKEPKEGHPDCARSALNGRTALRRSCDLRASKELALSLRLRSSDSFARPRCARQPSGRNAPQAAQTGPRLRSDGQAGLGAGHTAAANPISPFGVRYRSPALDRCGPSIPQGERSGAVCNEPRSKAKSLTRRPGRPAPAVNQRSQRNDGTLDENIKAYRSDRRAGSQEKQGSNAFRPFALVTFIWARK